ncbi:carbohydrate ABC transporter permease [Paenibacillus sp. PAMC21692]|uniref:carbohydrate ABC transporter permease n=1 Tax=Paenibacillus sp. PAMC21692 TaxID=2762320 RepID=UPI00164E5B65|nr:carbohydrate ABC transporter permease [Paenibacillus sp. PAMC21692]QNK60136.1 carbohydrate ABC transporter permease [Paenibacillus sp. PAMC21692]
MRNKTGLFDIVNIILMLGLIAVTLYPFWYMISVSLSGELSVMQGKVNFWPVDFTLGWYKTVFNDPRIGIGYRNTIMYAAVGTAIALMATSMGAFALSQKRMIFRKGIMLAIVFTILFGGGMIPSFLVVKELGILNTMWAMVLPGAVGTFNLLVFRTFFEGLPEELYDSGRIDGLNDIGLFFRIVMPLSKAVYAAIGLFSAVGIWNNFYSAIIYLRNPDLFPLTMILRDLIIKGTLDAEMAVQSTVGGDLVTTDALKFATIMATTLPILFLYPFLQKYFVKGVMLGSVKG